MKLLSSKRVTDLRKEAEAEIREEKVKAAKTRLKAKLQERERAAKILANCVREIEELELELTDELA